VIKIPKPKLVKVQFIGGSVLRVGEAIYQKGDVLEVPEKLLIACPDLYVKVEETAKVTEPSAVDTSMPEPTEEEEEAIKEIMEADTTTKAGKKKAEAAAKKVAGK